MIQNQEILKEEQSKDSQFHPQQIEVTKQCPYRLITGHWLTISRPQYKRTCGLSSLISIWNYQYSKIGIGNKQPISIQQAMLKLNLIGNGSVQENFRKRFKKIGQLTQKNYYGNFNQVCDQKIQQEEIQQNINYKNLQQYIDNVDFGVFTGNQALMKWYRLLCRIYGGSGRSYLYYKTNSSRSRYSDELSAKRGLIQDLNSNGKTCFIYHAYDHYFCPVGYEYTPVSGDINDDNFQSKNVTLEDNLCVLVGQSSRMFACIHSFNWNDIQLDLSTYWPKRYNIRRAKQGVTIIKGKQDAIPNTNTINCIMGFQKLRD